VSWDVTEQELRLYTADAAAALLGCEADWLTEQARKRKIPHVEFPGACNFTGTHVAMIIAMHEVLPAAMAPFAYRRPALAWTTAEAAELLRCKRSWLEEKARRKEIPYTRLSGAYHFSDAHLAEVIRIFEVHPRSEATPAVGPRAGHAAPADREQKQLQARSPRKPRAPATHRSRAEYRSRAD
jgi:excisionase family DNA binding protein